MKQKAIIIETKKYYEVRCKQCGKLILTYKKINPDIDRKGTQVIMVARCSRCKADNIIGI